MREKCGKFLHLSNVTDDPEAPDPWVRVLNGKRGLHRSGTVPGDWTVAGALEFSDLARVRGIAVHPRSACKLLATVPTALTRHYSVVVLADTEFGTVEFLKAVRQRSWRAVVGMRCHRKMSDGRRLQQLYRNGKRGQQVQLEGVSHPLTVSWFWLHRAEGKRELRFVVSTYPYSGAYLVRLGRKRSCD